MIESGLLIFVMFVIAYGVFEAVRRQQIRNSMNGIPMTPTRWEELRQLANEQQRVTNRWRREDIERGDNGGIERTFARGHRTHEPRDPEAGHKHKGGLSL